VSGRGVGQIQTKQKQKSKEEKNVFMMKKAYLILVEDLPLRRINAKAVNHWVQVNKNCLRKQKLEYNEWIA
jgi:hypothetical protein